MICQTKKKVLSGRFLGNRIFLMFIFLFDFNFLCCERCYVRFPTKKKEYRNCETEMMSDSTLLFFVVPKKTFLMISSLWLCHVRRVFFSSCGKDICNLNGFRSFGSSWDRCGISGNWKLGFEEKHVCRWFMIQKDFFNMGRSADKVEEFNQSNGAIWSFEKLYWSLLCKLR